MRGTHVFRAALAALLLAATGVAQDDTVRLAVQPDHSTRFGMIATFDVENTFDLPGLQVVSRNGTEFTYAYDVRGPSEDGGCVVDMTILRIAGFDEAPGKERVEYASDPPFPRLADPMRALSLRSQFATVGRSLAMTVGPDGIVGTVEAIDDVLENGMAADPSAAMDEGTARELRRYMELAYPARPGEPVSVGARWSATEEWVLSGMTLVLTTDYQVIAVTTDSVISEGEFVAAVKGGALGGAATLDSPHGTMLTTFSRADGLLLDRETELRAGITLGDGAGGEVSGSMRVVAACRRVPAESVGVAEDASRWSERIDSVDAPDGADAVPLSVRLAPGARLRYEFENRDVTNRKRGGTTEAMEAVERSTLDLRCVSVADDGSLDVAVTWARIRVSFDLPGIGKRSIDSAHPDELPEDERVAAVLQRRIKGMGETARIVILPDGRFDVLPEFHDVVDAQDVGGARRGYSLATVLEPLVALAIARPTERMVVGASWRTDRPLAVGGGRHYLRVESTVRSIGDDSVTISGDVTMRRPNDALDGALEVGPRGIHSVTLSRADGLPLRRTIMREVASSVPGEPPVQRTETTLRRVPVPDEDDR